MTCSNNADCPTGSGQTATAKPPLTLFTARGRDSLPHALATRLESVADVTYVTVLAPLTDSALVAHCRNAQLIGLTRRTCRDFHAGLIGELPHLRGLAIYATGSEWIDTVALATRQIELRVLADYSAQTVAEHALAMLLTLARRTHLSDRVVRGDLPASVSLRGWEVHGKRIGIVGFGRIGERIARLLQAFDAEITYHDPAVTDRSDFRVQPLDELLATSDVVVLAASSKRGRPPIIGAAEVAAMKPGAYLVNPARPQLVDASAVLPAIRNRQLAGYAVDERVYSPDDLATVEPGRILQTGHTGWYSDEAMQRGCEQWINHLIEMATQQ